MPTTRRGRPRLPRPPPRTAAPRTVLERFEAAWGKGAHSAPSVLRTYEAAARRLLDAGWDEPRIRQTVDTL
ncbi:hypothetical protein ACH4FX_41385 [Streptomyces sp. NPDC018019]|uniref:hypothetical protein n=1 Tax=Streptomyces sp. NPDC018019 TaxID=3365030 RepID=UPI0037958474